MELKPWRQAIPKGLILLVVTLGLIVPGSIAKQDQVSVLVMMLFRCEDTTLLPSFQAQERCVNGIRGRGSIDSACCKTLLLINSDCYCASLKKSPEGAKALGKVCGLSEREKHCASKDAEKKAAQAREKAAKDREVTLSKLDPCDRFFARLGAKEIDKINPDDAMACRREMKTCPPSCLRKQ
ncbi:hypothetical protein ACP70R_018395 [Stipagrostis hirtigluma subsp. patula]